MIYLKNTVSLKLFPDKCTGCGICIEVCPRVVFAMKDKKVYLVNSDRCIECGACARNCQFGALSVDAGVGCAAAVINGMIRGTEPACGCGEGSGSCC